LLQKFYDSPLRKGILHFLDFSIRHIGEAIPCNQSPTASSRRPCSHRYHLAPNSESSIRLDRDTLIDGADSFVEMVLKHKQLPNE